MQRQAADLVDHVHQDLGAECAKAGAGNGMLAQHRAGAGDLVHEAFGVRDLDAARAAHDDGLEVLGAHDRTHTAAACRAVLVVHDGCEQHAALAGGADGCDADLAVALFHGFGHGMNALAPQIGRIEQFNQVVIDVQVYRMVSLALEDDAVIAGVLEFGAEMAA